MKQHIKYSLLSIILCLSITSLSHAKTYRYDTAHSEVGFSVSHMVVSTVHGHFNDVTAELFWNPKKLKKSYLNLLALFSKLDFASKNTDLEIEWISSYENRKKVLSQLAIFYKNLAKRKKFNTAINSFI